MRHALSYTARALLPLAVVVSVACSSTGSMNTSAEGGADAATGAAGAITLRALNTHVSGETMTIFVEPEVGEQKTLGTVAGNATLNTPLAGAPGRYRFVAQRPSGERIISPYFNAQAGVYSWDIALNRVLRETR